MSTCISSHGEYSSHEPNANHYCRLCGAFDEVAVLAERDTARAEAEELRKTAVINAALYRSAEEDLAAVRERVEAVCAKWSRPSLQDACESAITEIRAALATQDGAQ